MSPCHASKLHPIAAILVLCANLFLVACQPAANSQAEPLGAETYFTIGIDGQRLDLQLALSSEEKRKGLMHRTSLGPNQGMLFLFEQAEKRGFWMKNTSIPLDLGYFDASGQLKEVKKLYPFDETPVPSYSRDILIAVETNRGWFTEHGIRNGAQIDLEALKAAVRERGFGHLLSNLN